MSTFETQKRGVVLATCLLTFPTILQADDNAAANRLLVAAVQAWDEASEIDETDVPELARRLELLESAAESLTLIVQDHPGADLAVRLVIGESVGPISIAGVEAALAQAKLDAVTPSLIEMEPAAGRYVAFAPDGNQLLVGGGRRHFAVSLFAAPSDERKWHSSDQGSSRVTAVDISPDGRHVLAAGGDGTTRVLDASTGNELRRLHANGHLIYAARFSLDGSRVLTGGGEGTARIWDVSSARELTRLEGHDGSVNTVAFIRDGTAVLTGGSDGTVRMWDVATGNEMRRFAARFGWFGRGPLSPVFSLEVSPSRSSFITGYANGKVVIWDLVTMDEARRFAAHEGGVNSVSFSPDGLQALTGGRDGNLTLWDVETGTEVRSLVGQHDSVSSASFSTDGRQVATGSSDGRTVRIWQLIEPASEAAELP